MDEDYDKPIFAGVTKLHLYWLGIAVTIITLVFLRVEVPLPVYPTCIFMLLLIAVALDQSWQNWKKSGLACLTSLALEEGGRSGYHPYDIRPATQVDADGKTVMSFLVFALGGFVIPMFAVQGSDAFIVCPPEYVEFLQSGMVCRAHLHKVNFEKMPRFIRDELKMLKHFDEEEVRKKRNLYFGMTSKMDGSATPHNLIEESKLLNQSEQITHYEQIINALYEQLAKKQPQMPFPIPEKTETT